jgi:hypothetical protein
MDTRNNNIKKILDVMNQVVNDIGLDTGLTAHEVYELISTVSKFMMSKKDDTDKVEISSIISSMNDHNLPGIHLHRIELNLSYNNRRIGLISGSSDNAWKIMYLISELFQSSDSVGNNVDDDNVDDNNQSDDEKREFTISEGLKPTLTSETLPSDFYKDIIDARKSLVANKKVMEQTDYFRKIDLSSCAYICGYDRFIDFNHIKMNSPAVVIRAGYGNQISQKDEKFEEYYKNAKANGLKVGAYWYSYAHTAEEAIQEVRAFIYVIADKQFDMPIVFDIEQNFLLNNTSVITMRTEIITLVRSYCNLYGFNVQFITLNDDGKIVSIDNDTN